MGEGMAYPRRVSIRSGACIALETAGDMESNLVGENRKGPLAGEKWTSGRVRA